MAESFFRRVWRWHFWAGLVACPVLLVVALTGALYTFREEIEDWQQADVRYVEPVGERKPLSEQIAAVKAAHPDWKPTRVTLAADPRKSTVVQVERPGAEKGSLPAVFVNPYTATVMADGDVRSPFFSAVLKLHRSLFAGTFGRVVVELTTSWTLVLLVSGVYLWWPKRWDRVWGVWLPRLRSRPYVVLRDLHTVGGAVLAPVIALIAFTGLFFTVVWLWSFNGVSNGAGNFPRDLTAVPPSQAPSAAARPVSVDVGVAAARERFPCQTLSLTLPKKPTDPFAFTARSGSGPSVDGSVAVDQYTGAVLSDKRAEHLSAVEQARLYVLPIHMGTIGGTATKVLALVACLVLAGLGVSGVWMWLARRPEGRWGFPRASEARVPKPAVIVILLLAVTLPTVGLSLVVVLVGEWLMRRIRTRYRCHPVSATEGNPGGRIVIPARRGLTAVVVIALLSGTGCSRTDRIPVHPVSGQVLLDGRPLPNATVFLCPQGGPGSGLRPVGHTRADGSFEVTTYETGDGAPAGDYRVTVTWAAGKHIDKPEAAADETVTVQSPAEYASPEKTPLTCTVTAGSNRLVPFKLNGKSSTKR